MSEGELGIDDGGPRKKEVDRAKQKDIYVHSGTRSPRRASTADSALVWHPSIDTWLASESRVRDSRDKPPRLDP